MSRRIILQSPVEDLEPWEMTRARLEEFSKQDLAKFVHDLIGGSWSSIRSRSKYDLIRDIQDHAERHPEG